MVIDLPAFRSQSVLMRTRGDMLRFAIAFALMRARKLVRGLRHELSEDERFLVADDVVHQLQQHGDPWALSQELPQATGRAHSTPPLKQS
jgi:hypothetical protein